MGDSCPQPDTRNRYQGRGSGDRIARLKQIATREGPAPMNQNSESWLLTKQQGCCDTPCISIPCSIPTYNIPWPLVTESGLQYYVISGITVNTNIIFNVAEMTTNCTATAGCYPKLSFYENNIYPQNVSVYINDVDSCNTPISLQVPVTSTLPVYTDIILISVGYTDNCSGKGDVFPIRLKLTSPP